MSRSGIRAARARCGGRRERVERTEILKITRPDPERTPPRGARADRPCMATGCGTQRPPTVRHGVIACAQRGARGVQSILGHGWGGAVRPDCRGGASVSTCMPSGFLSMGNTGAAASGRAPHVLPRRGVAGKQAGKRMPRMHDACRMEKIMPCGHPARPVLPFVAGGSGMVHHGWEA